MNKSAKWVGVVTRATLPVRKNPNAKAGTHSYSPLIKGDTVRVCDTAKGWYYIETDGKYGYVNSKYVRFSESVKSAKPSKTVKWIGKTSQSVTLRTSPTTVQFSYELAEPIEYTLTPQEVKTYLGQNNIWNDTGDTEVTYLSKEE